MPPAKKQTPTPATDEVDWKPILLDVVRDLGKPATPAVVAALTDLKVARVTAVLDDLVTDSLLVLGDDQLYRIPDSAASADQVAADVLDAVKDGGVVTIEGDYDDSADFETRTVAIPTSDLLRFLTTINLPPQLIEGLGTLSNLKGFLSYDPVEATAEDPHPVRRFRVTVEGDHSAVFTPSNYPAPADSLS
jgi:hypothetical protein